MKRILRVIEYTGTDEFLRACVDRRQVKGTRAFPDGFIREAILGDTPEILNRQASGPVLETLMEMGLLSRTGRKSEVPSKRAEEGKT